MVHLYIIYIKVVVFCPGFPALKEATDCLDGLSGFTGIYVRENSIKLKLLHYRIVQQCEKVLKNLKAAISQCLCLLDG